jgi:hypothetical protein
MKGFAMKKIRKLAAATLLPGLLALAPMPALAHHSYAMFDMNKTVTLAGKVVKFKWQNPHAFIQLEVPVKGNVELWVIEMTSPNNLAIEGWKRSSLNPGDNVSIQVHPLRDGGKGGSFAAVKLANGATLGTWQ